MNDKYKELLAGYIDGELSEQQRADFERELAQNPQLRAELDEFSKLKEVTNSMKYADLPDEVWETYWSSMYRKLERGIGWILFSLGAILLLSFGLYEIFSQLYADPNAPLWLKIGLSGAGLGLIFLLVSYGRERLFAHKRDRYSEVTK